jgi:hypothetical protein
VYPENLEAIASSQDRKLGVEMSVRVSDRVRSAIAGLVWLALLSAAATAQTVTGRAASRGSDAKPQEELSVTDRTAQRPSSVTLMQTGDWRCCVPAGSDDVRVSSPHHPNAPKTFGGALKFGGDAAAVSIGIIGSQNARLPQFMSTTLAGTAIPTPDVPSFSDMSRSSTRWQLVASAQKNVFTSKRGVTVGITGDVFVPVGTESPDGTPAGPLISSRAVRFGVKLGF